MNDKKLSEEELGYRMLRMYYHKTENLYSLKPNLRLLICEKAKVVFVFWLNRKSQIF